MHTNLRLYSEKEMEQAIRKAFEAGMKLAQQQKPIDHSVEEKSNFVTQLHNIKRDFK